MKETAEAEHVSTRCTNGERNSKPNIKEGLQESPSQYFHRQLLRKEILQCPWQH